MLTLLKQITKEAKMNNNYDIVVGLEIHAELNSKTKVFCSCENKFGAEPNTLVCPICLGMPGTLPNIDKKCVELAIKSGLMTNCKINQNTIFERKNYFYPDLTKSYQISQLISPLCYDGYVELDSGKKIRIENIHLEEDAGKLVHIGDKSYIDYNRCGVALIETVTRPDISNADEAVEFLTKLRNLFIYGDIANCKLEQGGMRFDVNLSVKPKGSDKLGVRTEMKNLSSFRSVKHAIEYEANRQIQVLENGGTIVEETRKWDDSKNQSLPMRVKDSVNTYRYFPDPDLPQIHIGDQVLEQIKKTIPLSEQQLKSIYKEKYNLPDYDIGVLVSDKKLSDFFNECIKIYEQPKDLSNWILGELLRNVKDQINITAEQFVQIINMSNQKLISRTNAVPLIAKVMETGEDPQKLAKQMDILNTMNDGDLEPIIDKLLSDNPKAIEDYKTNPDKIMTFFTGQIMKQTRGKANVALAKKLLSEKLG